ncbi:MAG: hypothetical protein QM723_21315 [Myxococcaceae bacterium]
MLRRVLLVTLLLAGCREKKVTPDDGDLSVTPETIDLGTVWAGYPVSRPASVRFSGMSTCEVTLSASAPFSVTPSVHLEKASSANITVSVTSSGAGSLSGTLTATGCGHTATAMLAASSFAVPDCGSEGACTTVRFDADAGMCTTDAKPDGTHCGDPCLDQPHCVSGDCVGTSASCDDLDPCTIDACGVDGGCVHIPGQGLCPPLPGCTASCDGGHCGTLAEIWSHPVSEQPLDPLVADPQGNVYWLEDDNQLNLTGWLESVSRSGLLRYKVGVLLVGSDAWPMFAQGQYVYVQSNGGSVFGIDGANGSLLWRHNLREDVEDAGATEVANGVERLGHGTEQRSFAFAFPVSFSVGSQPAEGFAVGLDMFGSAVARLVNPPYALETDETYNLYVSVQSSNGYSLDAYLGNGDLLWSDDRTLGPVAAGRIYTPTALIDDGGTVLATFSGNDIAPDIATPEVAMRRDTSLYRFVFFDPLTGADRARVLMPDLANWDVYALAGDEVLAVNRTGLNRVDGFDIDGGHLYQCDVPLPQGQPIFGSSVLIDDLLLMWTSETNGYVLHAYAMPGRREAATGWVARYGSAARTNHPKW